MGRSAGAGQSFGSAISGGFHDLSLIGTLGGEKMDFSLGGVPYKMAGVPYKKGGGAAAVEYLAIR